MKNCSVGSEELPAIIILSNLGRKENQPEPENRLPEWEPGYASFPDFGACEILKSYEEKKFTRLIGTQDTLQVAVGRKY